MDNNERTVIELELKIMDNNERPYAGFEPKIVGNNKRIHKLYKTKLSTSINILRTNVINTRTAQSYHNQMKDLNQNL